MFQRQVCKQWALTVRDHCNMLADTDVGVQVKGLFSYGGRGMSWSRSRGYKIGYSLVFSHMEVAYKKNLSTLGRRFDSPPFPEICLSIVVLCLALGISISPSDLIIGRATAALSIVCVVVRWE